MKNNWRRAARQATAVVAAVFSLGASAAQAGERSPLVVGASLKSLGGVTGDTPHQRFVEGAKIYFKRVNASGGIDGHPIEIIAADDGGLPERYRQNMRTLMGEHDVVALLGCVGDDVCEAAAEVSAELRVPLIGAQSGTRKIARDRYPLVFRVRSDYLAEANAVATQLAQLGTTRVALLTNDKEASELDGTLRQALDKNHITVQVLRVEAGESGSLAATMRALAAAKFHAAVINLDFGTVDRIVDDGFSESPAWPSVLFMLSNGNLGSVLNHFKSRTIAFTQVVPHPIFGAHGLAREFEFDGSKYAADPQAFTLEGMEGYVSARLLVAALRKTGAKNAASRLPDELKAATGWNFSGFQLNFGSGRSTGSDWVKLGLRSRTGALVN